MNSKAFGLKKLGLVALVPLCIIVWLTYKHYTKPADNTAKLNRIAVNAVTLQPQVLPQIINATGSTKANNRVEISPEIAGQVSAILFKAGQFVTPGQALIKLDDAIYKAQASAATADLKLSELQFKRLSRLRKKGLTPESTFDAAQADLRDKQSSVHVSQTQLAKMVLRAPFDGRLGLRMISVGDYVKPGQGLLTIVEDDPIRVQFNIPEAFLAKLKIGQSITVETTALQHQQFKGTVSFIAPYINEDTRTITVEGQLPNPNHALSPGLFVSIALALNDAKPHLLIPEAAVVPNVSGATVFKIEKNRALQVPVQLGWHTDHHIVIKKGLKANDVIVTRGQQKLKDGSFVTILKS